MKPYCIFVFVHYHLAFSYLVLSLYIDKLLGHSYTNEIAVRKGTSKHKHANKQLFWGSIFWVRTDLQWHKGSVSHGSNFFSVHLVFPRISYSLFSGLFEQLQHFVSVRGRPSDSSVFLWLIPLKIRSPK